MSELASVMKRYPQVLVNVKVREEAKGQYENDSQVTKAIQIVEKQLKGDGRVLIRPSGTEALIRVMIEGLDQDDINKKAKKIADVIEKKFTPSNLSGKKECKRALQELAGLPVDPLIPVVSMVSRLASHKGFDLVKHILPEILDLGVQFILLGTGETEIEEYFRKAQERYPNQVKVFFEFNKDLSKKIYAGSDIFLMPSKSEPCGLAQMISSRYGPVPVVRETGGLYDTIKPYNKYTDEGNGFTFANYNAHEMKDAIARATELYKNSKKWEALMKKIMKIDFSWNASAEKYMSMYNDVANRY
jgi:starch synthase